FMFTYIRVDVVYSDHQDNAFVAVYVTSKRFSSCSTAFSLSFPICAVSSPIPENFCSSRMKLCQYTVTFSPYMLLLKSNRCTSIDTRVILSWNVGLTPTLQTPL